MKLGTFSWATLLLAGSVGEGGSIHASLDRDGVLLQIPEGAAAH